MRCPACGLAALANVEFPDPEPIPIEEHDAEFFAAYIALKREGAGAQAWRSTLSRLDTMVPAPEETEERKGPERPRLFDVGAGDGEFLDLARSRGYEPAGNELMEGAVRLAKDRYGIDLALGDLADIDIAEGHYDAATMWCVLAHVPDPDRLLSDTRRLLKPGGVLFMQTPRNSSMDRIALAGAAATRGRMVRVLDRRLAVHHWQLHTVRSMRATLERNGYEVLAIEPKARYSLRSWSYLNSLGLSEGLSRRLGGGVDVLLDRGMFFRIVLDVYARKPVG